MRVTFINNALYFLIFFTVLLSTESFAQTEPKVEGSPFKEIDYEEYAKKLKKEDREKIKKQVKNAPAPKGTAKAPKARTRSGDLIKNNRTIYQFTNHDFVATHNTCGQAAVATAMWNRGLNATWNNNASDFAKQLYNYAPPKITVPNVGSTGLGTDWRQISYALDGYKRYGIQYNWFKGRALLDKYIDMGLPCIIMLDMGIFGATMWGSGHWVVAFSRNSDGYYITNWDSKWNGRHYYLPWSELNRAWGGVWNEGQLAKVHGTAEMFCVVWK